MKRYSFVLVALLALAFAPLALAADEEPTIEEQIEEIKEEMEELEDRLMKPERHSALDNIEFSGDIRVEAHSISADIPAHYDGLALQNLFVKSMFWFNPAFMNMAPPSSVDELNGFIAQNYADWLYFTDNLTFDQFKQAMGTFPEPLQQALMQLYLPAVRRDAYNADNDLMYTTRLRLRLRAEIAEDVKFDGRLSMYKVWGDSTGVQVFNGQPTSVNVDGTTAGVPNSDILRVERAYFTWSDIAGAPVYLSIGRRPSTGGVPLNFRQDEMRAGTPLGSLIDYQFDGITVGWHITEASTLRLCYGVGYESGFGSGDNLKLPADRLDDVPFLGLNWDILDTPDMYIQATVARAFDVTDGFNGLVVLPADPLTGNPIKAPVVLRFTPSANLGDIDLASLVFVRHDGPLDYFISANYSASDPNNVTTPFGGLFSDPFEVPEERSGTMWYAGVRYRFNDDRTKIGLEYNTGSKYWFNFAVAEDDIIAPKTNTRGDVFEVYLTHRIRDRFIFKLDYIDYDYEYSGSGWQVGAPKDLDSMPTLGFPTYDSASKISATFIGRF